MDGSLANPLTAAHAIVRLKKRAGKLGITVSAGSDFNYFQTIHKEGPGTDVSVFFDPNLSDLNQSNAMWIAGHRGGELVHIQAFRTCYVGEGFRQWFMTWMLGMHNRRGEKAVIKRFEERETEQTANLRGRLVYHGDVWVKSENTGLLQGPVDCLGPLGLLAAYVKWRPEAIFAMVSERLIKRGITPRYGYPYVERGFVTWKKIDAGIAGKEGLAVARHGDLEDLIVAMMDRRGSNPLD